MLFIDIVKRGIVVNYVYKYFPKKARAQTADEE